MVATSRTVPGVGAGPSDPREERKSGMAAAWPLIVLFPMVPVWWVLGISGLILSLCIYCSCCGAPSRPPS